MDGDPLIPAVTGMVQWFDSTLFLVEEPGRPAVGMPYVDLSWI